MANKQDRKGRSKSAGKFVMLSEYVLRSEAYRHLSVYGRALLVEFIRKYDGTNNGFIALSVRDAQELLGCSDRPTRKALKELQDKGFVTIRKKGAYSRKVPHATEWALTEHPIGQTPATKDFMRWVAPEIPVKKLKHGGTRAKPQWFERPPRHTKEDTIPTHSGSRDHCQRPITPVHGGSRDHTYISIPYGEHEAETLKHISTLMPDGWCNSKAQASSGMGNKVVPLPVKNQSEQVTERQAISVGGNKQ